MTRIIRAPEPTLGFLSGGFYANGALSGADTTLLMVLDRLYQGIFHVPVATTFDQIGCTVTTLGSAGAVVRLGVYSSSGGAPAALVLDAGTVDTTTTGAKTVSISLTLQPGFYYTGGVAQVAVCTVRNRPGPHALVPEAAVGSAQVTSYNKNTVTGALPDPFASTSRTTDLIKVQMRAA